MKKKLLAATLAAALSSGMIVSGMTPVYAADTAPATTEATAKEKAAERPPFQSSMYPVLSSGCPGTGAGT